MKVETFKNLFEASYYSPAYKRWRIDHEKAGKDIIGEEYERFRREFYTTLGFESVKGYRIFGSSYNADIVVTSNGRVVIIEEAKGSYVDSCFLKRAITDAADIFDACIEQQIDIPSFVLSCPTKMNNYDEIFTKTIKLFRTDLKDVLERKFVYLPLCEHDRVIKNKHFISEKNSFDLSDTLIAEQIKFTKLHLHI